MRKIASEHDLTLESTTHKDLFGELIVKLFEKYQTKVVLLIDEYDKPLIDYLDNLPQAEENRSELK
ncbi:MAG: hypothetical protein EAZ97_00730, partial [Bacteroidetes bacterium]